MNAVSASHDTHLLKIDNKVRIQCFAPYQILFGLLARTACTYATIEIIIQHIDTLPKYGQKRSMYVGPHDVYPTIDVNFSILTRECNKKGCRQYFLFKLCFVINVLNFKTIIAHKLA